MTPTWKVGDVFYRFIDAVDYMRVYAFTVTKVHKLKTEVQSRSTRAVVTHRVFVAEYAETEAGAVELAIKATQQEASFHLSVAGSKQLLANTYKKFLSEMKNEQQIRQTGRPQSSGSR